ncbi:MULTISPECIES: family 78 glycoside hydrolase catalytic domain [Nocardioides]|uniref:alpha-L-rhamnosidase n=1 Tax=Nocardioides vastitatis TaxID=2568655 RepID=A0ABW0ZIS5_9ACTN|nr:family 78 glycoside hydrolase catalytic domain [Nocardioides sp.]THI95795.1 alpha-L-rhamnosidase [Nocardioides sp.]
MIVHHPRRMRRTVLAVVTAVAVAAPAAAGWSPAEATPGTRPAAPTRLTVDDVPAPLNADESPRFGWLPRDADANEVQTAYKIEVRDVDGALVWDSDKVKSAQQSYVEYDGSPLAPGSVYRWRVRTWDKDHLPSPWSAETRFETGLDDGDWGGASWIRRPPGNPGFRAVSVVDGRGRVSGGNVTLASTGTDWTDYVVTMDVTPVSRAAGVVFRAPDSANGYMWQLHANDNALKTHRMVAGGFPTDARRAVRHVIDPGVTYELSIRVMGRTFQTSIDGVVVDTWTDPSPSGSTAGTIGFRQAGGEVADFDDIRVTSLDGSRVLFEEDFSSGLDKWVKGTTTREADEYTLARTEVDVPAGTIVRARSYLAASHVAELYLDGKRADRMTNYGHPGEGYYQAADITDLVTPGERLSVGAMLHWFSSGQGRVGAEPGLLVRLVVEYADGSEFAVVSDGTWKVRRGPYVLVGTRNGEGLYVEHLDGAAQRAIGPWKQGWYDDSAWSDAVVLGKHPVAPFTHLDGQQTRLTETVVRPERIFVADDGTPVADFGKVIPARPAVHFDKGVAGRKVTIRASYGLTETGRASTASTATQGTNMSFPYTQAAGDQDYRAFGHLGFRYLEIPGAEEEITADDVTATVVHTSYPQDGAATFDSSDDTLDAVWDLMDRSLRYSVQETFVDTPTREQGQFLHDTVNISYGLMATQHDRVATRQAIREFMLSQKRWWTSGDDIGRYNAVYPNGDNKRDIPDFTQVVPDWAWRYYLETGDLAALEDVYDNVAATAAYVRRHIPAAGPTRGLVTQLTGGSGQYRYGIVDWPVHGRFGYDMTATARTTVNALGVDVLRKVALVAEEIGRPEAEVAAYVADADALADRMNETLRKPDGTYVDGLLGDGFQSPHAGQHATSYAVALGIAPTEDLPELGAYLASMGMKQGPMTAHWLLEALALSGAHEHLLNVLTNEDDYGWAGWLAAGGTFTPEAWELSGSANSASHGWGSRGIVQVMENVLGIEVTAPGGAELRISVPDTGLTHAEGSQLTQRGRVLSAWARDDQGVALRTTIPVNASAVVDLPAGRYDVRGPGGASAEQLVAEGGLTRYRVGSGEWTFTQVDAG